jgi:Holliday junction resolvasome RuvABC endonuclease subunit
MAGEPLMRSLGLDLSTKATGLVLLAASENQNPWLILEETISFPKLKGFDLYMAIAKRIMEVANEYQPARIVLEGYSLNLKNASSVVPLVELGGLVRFFLKIDGYSWLDPRAGELKKFITGKGGTPKDMVVMHVLKRWGHEARDNNTADAYGCACIGLCHANKLRSATKEMRAIVGSLKLNSN